MPRMPRVHLNGVLYYVTQQGAHDRSLFCDAEDHQTYLDLLAQYKTKHQFHLFAFSLLSDKINLIIEPYGAATISEIMRDLTSRYSKYYNGRYGAEGSLFKGRFQNVMAEKETLLLKLVHFVHSLVGAVAATGVENSRYLISAGHAGVAAPFRHAMKTEMDQLSEKVNQMGYIGGLETLAVPMSADKMSALQKMLKDPVIGSADFVRRVRVQMVEAADKSQQDNQHGNELAAGPAPKSHQGVNLPKWAFAGMAALACAAIILPVSHFFFAKKTPEKISSAVVAVAQVEPQKEAVLDDRSTLHASVVVLDGTEWNVKLIPTGNKDKTAVDYDRITFAKDQVVSKNMAARGFQPTFYTLTTNADGTVVWETMQTGPDGQMVSWRGEWSDGQMRGVINQQMASGETRTFHFVGSK